MFNIIKVFLAQIPTNKFFFRAIFKYTFHKGSILCRQ
jgi:hypothetical protein